MSESVLTTKKKGYLCSVNCPVDVEIYEKDTNELVGRIVNNTVDETVAAQENSVVMYVDGESKCYWLPEDGAYTVKLIGNGEGTMDYTLTSAPDEHNDFLGWYEDGTRVCETESYAFVAKRSRSLTAAFTDKTPVQVAVETVTDCGSTVEGAGEYYTGDSVTLTARPAGKDFLDGWYVDGECVSSETVYTFTAAQDVTVRAVFMHPVIESVSVGDRTERAKTSFVLKPDVQANGTDYTLTYQSDNEQAAAVDADGKVTTNKRGTAHITVTATDEYGNTVSDTCTVTVKYAWWQWIIRILLLGFIWY